MPKRLKRILDFLFSITAIIFLIPFWIIISLLILIENPGPVFFKQKRVGRYGSSFTIYKFRSMYVNDAPPLELGEIKHNHLLVTKVGYFLRRTKLDETPQFIHVLIGTMSLVGPRPCLPERIPTMSYEQKKRFEFAPGLTGWAEVNGNVELSWEEQIFLDLWYIYNWNFNLDIKILLKTIYVVIFGSTKNINAIRNAKRLLENKEKCEHTNHCSPS